MSLMIMFVVLPLVPLVVVAGNFYTYHLELIPIYTHFFRELSVYGIIYQIILWKLMM